MSTGTITTEELSAALNLSDEVKSRINEYERQNWAANLASPDVQAPWKRFLSVMESALRDNRLADDLLIQLIQYLSTIDTASLLEKLRSLDPERQSRFIDLLNWVAQESPDPSQRLNANSVRERVLMAYRLAQFPIIYSPARLTRATHVISEKLSKGTLP